MIVFVRLYTSLPTLEARKHLCLTGTTPAHQSMARAALFVWANHKANRCAAIADAAHDGRGDQATDGNGKLRWAAHMHGQQLRNVVLRAQCYPQAA